MNKNDDSSNGVSIGRKEILPARERSKTTSRRAFVQQIGAAAGTAAAVLATPVAGSAESASGRFAQSPSSTAQPPGVTNGRILEAFQLRADMAMRDALKGPAVNVNNGDSELYADKGGTYTKALPHDAYGRVDLSAFATFGAALNSGEYADFEKIVMGGTRTLNGPQGGLCFDLDVPDNVQFGRPEVPPAPRVASDQTAIELVEHYWASLMRDVAFTEYGSSALAAQAAAELGSQPA